MPSASVSRLVPSLRRFVAPLEQRLAASDTHAAARQALAGWIIGLRWVALIIVTLLVAVAMDLDRRLLPEAAAWLWGGVAALLIATVAFTLVGPRRLASPLGLCLQIGADLAVIGWMLHASGGMANPFAGAIALHAILAALALPGRLWITSTVIAAAALTLTLLQATGVTPPLPLGGAEAGTRALLAGGAATTLLVLGGGWIAGSIAATLQRDRDRLAELSRGLALEQQKLGSIIDCMGDAVVFADPDGRIALRNRAAAQLWAGRPGPTQDLRVCHSAATWERLLAKLADPAEQEPHPTLSAGGRSFEASYARVCDGAGALRGVVMVARDVTDRLEAQSLRAREERAAVVGKLAAGLAHEINNPLGAIALFARLGLKALPGDHPVADHLVTVLRNADHAKRIVKDLLTYARQRPPERRRLAVAAALEDAARTLRAPAERAGVRLELDAAPVAVDADPDQLAQVLMNLGLNAIEAMPDGGTLALSARPDGDEVRIEVRDTGPGVPDEERDRIFSAFHTTKPEGTGLGLAVVRDIVEAHRGRVQVTSGPGVGATFTVTLSAAEQRA
jgi:signal transduction histidine kinase